MVDDLALDLVEYVLQGFDPVDEASNLLVLFELRRWFFPFQERSFFREHEQILYFPVVFNDLQEVFNLFNEFIPGDRLAEITVELNVDDVEIWFDRREHRHLTITTRSDLFEDVIATCIRQSPI